MLVPPSFFYAPLGLGTEKALLAKIDESSPIHFCYDWKWHWQGDELCWKNRLASRTDRNSLYD